jgi:hypothetical protein
MDEIRFDARAYDPARVNAVLREARRMRNEAMIDMVKALFDGRLATRLFGPSTDKGHDLPKGTAAHH